MKIIVEAIHDGGFIKEYEFEIGKNDYHYNVRQQQTSGE